MSWKECRSHYERTKGREFQRTVKSLEPRGSDISGLGILTLPTVTGLVAGCNTCKAKICILRLAGEDYIKELQWGCSHLPGSTICCCQMPTHMKDALSTSISISHIEFPAFNYRMPAGLWSHCGNSRILGRKQDI